MKINRLLSATTFTLAFCFCLRSIQAQPRQNRRPVVVHKKVERKVVVVHPQKKVIVARPAAKRTTVVVNRPVYNANNPGWRYSQLPRRNAVITTVPVGYRTINYGGYAYRYNNGVFYRPYNNTFTVVAPPAGIFVNALPIGYRKIYVNRAPYYYYNGTYYNQQGDNNYVVVSPPVGALVESIPEGYETVQIDGNTYYTVDGAQYRPAVQENGEIWYEVIKAN